MTRQASTRARIGTLAIDAATIGSVALVLAAFYCGSKIVPPVEASLLFPRLRSFDFNFAAPDYFPWTDLAANVFMGFALAHGWPIVDAGTVNHMPGVAQYLGAWFWLFGFGGAAPSPQTAAAAYLVACFATLVFEAACVYVPLRLLAFSPSLAGLASLAVCASTAFAYDFAMPMSETLIAYLLIPMSLLAARTLLADSSAERVVAAILLGGPATLVCLALGLTVAPANAVIALACLVVLVRELRREPANWRVLLHDRRCQAAYAIVVALSVATLVTTRASTLYFWAVASNSRRKMALLMRPSDIVADHLSGFLQLTDPLGSRFPQLLLVLLASCTITWLAARRRADRSRLAIRLALFAALIVTAAVMTQWRTGAGYKSATLLGLTVGVGLLALESLPSRWRALSAIWLTPLWLLALGQIMFLRAAVVHPAAPPVRPAAFEAAHVCRLDQTQDCRCVQVTVYGPQLFILNDMRPCPNRNLTFDSNAGALAVTRRWITDDARNRSMVFWVYQSDSLMLENGVPPELVRYWRTQAQCERIDDTSALCHPRE